MKAANPCFVGTRKVQRVVREIKKTSVQHAHPETGAMYDKYVGKIVVGRRDVVVHSWGRGYIPTVWFTE